MHLRCDLSVRKLETFISRVRVHILPKLARRIYKRQRERLQRAGDSHNTVNGG